MAVIVHGGAFAIPDAIADVSVAGCRKAADEAYKVLIAGKSAVDAVEVAVRNLEDDPVFDAGHGSFLNIAGKIEMDSIIIDGGDLAKPLTLASWITVYLAATLKYGAVAGVRDISNPISLARMVMEKTDHVMLIGEGANIFAMEMGVPKVDPLELITPEAKKAYEEFDRYNTVVSEVFNVKDEVGHDTVGAVAMDIKGNLAAATSTGGISLKRVGRVGDVPLIGSGAYCDNDLGGVSCTGHGESIAKVLLAYRALTQLKPNDTGSDIGSAFKESLEYMLRRVNGHGGMIGISKSGMIAKHFTTPHMCWASTDKNGVKESGI